MGFWQADTFEGHDLPLTPGTSVWFELMSTRFDEAVDFVRRSAEQGTLEANTARLLTRSLDFGDRTASDVMTPRVRCSGIERTARADDRPR